MNSRTAKTYRTLSQIFFNAFIVFVAANICGGIFLWVRDFVVRESPRSLTTGRPGEPALTSKRNGYQMAWVDTRAYGNYSTFPLDAVLDDFYDFQLTGSLYEPYVQFTTPVFSGKTLNFKRGPSGFELRETTPVPGATHKIFVFGGSTAMGWNVADRDTLVNRMQDMLNLASPSTTEVRNYGRPNYSWYQELVLFQRMIHAGERPDEVVFLDGVNIENVKGARQVPHWSADIAKAWDAAQFRNQLGEYPGALPFFRMINFFLRYSSRDDFEAKHRARVAEIYSDMDPKSVRQSYLNVIQQVNALARAFGIKTHFFWQPNRAYGCNETIYSTKLPSDHKDKVGAVYSEMEQPGPYHNLSKLCGDFGEGRPIFLDDVHYNPEFSSFLAKRMIMKIRPKIRSSLENRGA